MAYGCSEVGDRSGFRGCGRQFAGLAYFDAHFIKVGRADDPERDRAKESIVGDRCRTDAELREVGLRRRQRDGQWYDPREAERVAEAYST